MKKKVASILLILTMIMCQTPALAFAAENPADAPMVAQQDQQTIDQKDDTDSEQVEENTMESKPDTTTTANQKSDSEPIVEGTDVAFGETPAVAGALGTMDTTEPQSIEESDNTIVKTNETAEMYIHTPGHGKIKVNGSDYGTECRGTWTVGTGVTIEAIADSGYKLNMWWLKKNGGGGDSFTNSKITVLAGSYPEAIAAFGLEEASVSISAPVAGQTAAGTPNVKLPSGAGYIIDDNMTFHHGNALQWVKADTLGNIETLPETTVFQEGQTYYAYVRLAEGTDSFAATAGGSTFNTNLAVSGGTKKAQGNFASTRTDQSGYIGIETIIAVTVPASEQCTVSFDMDGHYTNINPQTVAKGDKANRPASPKNYDQASDYATTGLHFCGWYNKPIKQISSYTEFCYTPANGGCIFDFDTPITQDTKIYAAYEGVLTIKSYDVTNSTEQAGGSFDYNNYNSAFVDNSKSVQTTAFYDLPEFLKAKPEDGYKFVGWSTSTSKDNIISTSVEYTYTFKKNATLYALFEKKPADLILHWSSVDGADLMKPVTISVPPGTTINQALNTKNWTLDSEVFSKAGYKDSKYRTKKLITNYTDETGLQNDSVDGTSAITADTNIYYIMYKEIDKVSAGIESPVCGTGISNTIDVPPYDQNVPPAVSVSSGSNYQLNMVDSKPYAFWAKNGTDPEAFTGKIEGEKNYYARFMLNADFGYVFANNPTASLDNAEVTMVQNEHTVATIMGSVTAVHNWGDWKVETEATETEEGLEARTCKTPDCTGRETRPIDKLKVIYSFTSGDGSKWEKGSDDDLRFVVNRNRNDAATFEHFRGIKVDGAEVPANEFTATAGSVVIVLHSSYLKTLSKGSHTITAVFDDGNKETSAKFSVVTKSKSGSGSDSDSPKTGDDSRVLVWIVILCTAGLALSERMIRRLKEHRNNR